MTGRFLKCAAFLGAGLMALAPAAMAAEAGIDLVTVADVRLTLSDADGSGAHAGGQSLVRFGDGANAARLAFASLELRPYVGRTFDGLFQIRYDTQGGLDLIEAYGRYQTPDRALSLRFGLMFPPVSRENVADGWQSPYTITPSAINSWVGEELKVLGSEASWHWRAGGHDVTLSGALFGFNDTAGTLLAWRGWAMTDRMVGAFEGVTLRQVPSLPDAFPEQAWDTKPVYEVDNRLGYYLRARWQPPKGPVVDALYYSNRADPQQVENGQYGWDTRFLSLSLEGDIGRDWHYILQGMEGATQMGWPLKREPDRRAVDAHFRSAYALLSVRLPGERGEGWRVSGRVDLFEVIDRSWINIDNNNQSGHAVTLAAARRINDWAELWVEGLHSRQSRPAREASGLARVEYANQLQVSLRAVF